MIKNILIVIIAIIIFALLGYGIWWQYQKQTANEAANQEAQMNQQTAPEDSTAGINKDLNSIDVGDVNKDFQDVDKDINSL